jgi:Flp pilus assembly protein TadG
MKHFKLLHHSSLRKAERGEDATFEFSMMIVPMMAVIFMIAFVAIYWASKLPARAAATECARVASATLDQAIGVDQGELAGRESLANNNINADLSNPFVLVQVTPSTGGWNRGDIVTCTVRYRINLADSSQAPAIADGSVDELLNGIPANVAPAGLEIVEIVRMKVDPLKSKWN